DRVEGDPGRVRRGVAQGRRGGRTGSRAAPPGTGDHAGPAAGRGQGGSRAEASVVIGPPSAIPPRVEDIFRHLQDLQARSYEGVEPRAERVELFRRAVELLDPLVRTVLDETDREFLKGTGTIEHRPVAEEASGDAVAGGELSWPAQREAENVRGGGRVGPGRGEAGGVAGCEHPHPRGKQGLE